MICPTVYGKKNLRRRPTPVTILLLARRAKLYYYIIIEEQAENEDIGDDEDLPDATRNTIRSLQNYYNCMYSGLYFSSLHNLTQYTLSILVWYILSLPESLAATRHVQEPPPPPSPQSQNEENIKKMYCQNM